jgi:AraC family transcriptional regulator
MSLEERRIVTGELVRELISGSLVARVEFLRRASDGILNLSLRQRALALYWFGRGFHHAQLSVDDQPVEATLSSGSSFALVAAEASLEGEFHTDGLCDYAVMFVSSPALAAHVRATRRSLRIFDDRRLFHGFQDLHDEVLLTPEHRDLLVEGWALQAMVRLVRQIGSGERATGNRRLSPAAMERVDDLITARIAEPIRVDDLADAAGYSTRHFARVFKSTTGKTPIDYVMERRVKNATALIRDGATSMTTVALRSGFATPQHFSTTFRRQVGLSPRQFASTVGST